MTAVEVVKEQIGKLVPAERAEVSRWLEEQEQADWDAKIRRDHAAGKLDGLIQNARRKAAEGRLGDLPT